MNETVTLAHGAGGRQTAELIDRVFKEHFSNPDLTSDVERLIPIPGFMSDPTNLPEGCKFAERCPHCTERCRKEAPKLYEDGGHSIRCFLYETKGGQ